MAFDRDASIMAQNAGSTAAVLYAAELKNTGGTFDPERYAEIREYVFLGTTAEAYGNAGRPTPAAAAPSPAVDNVVAQFPGAQVIPNQDFPAPPPAGTFPAGQVVGSIPQAQPAPLPQPGQQLQPGSSKKDQEWMAFFNNPGAFYDNRADKAAKLAQGQAANGPDFKSKKDSGFPTEIALWVDGKYPAPGWVKQRLGIA